MKKLVGVFLFICLAFGLTGCAKLPDPTPAVQTFFDEFLKPDGEAFMIIRNSDGFQQALERYPEASDAIDRYINACIHYMTIEIDESKTIVSARGGQANLSGTITTLADNAISDLPLPVAPYTPAEWYDYLTENINSGGLNTKNIAFTIKLNYDKETETWTIDGLDTFKASLIAV